MLATKMHLDIQIFYSPLKIFSLIGGVSEKELCTMELEFVSLLNYKLFINED